MINKSGTRVAGAGLITGLSAIGATAAVLAGTVAAAVAAPTPSAAPSTVTPRAQAAAAWSYNQLVNGQYDTGYAPGLAGADWGLTIDTLFALEAGDPASAKIAPLWQTIAANSASYYQYQGSYFPGSIGKLLYAATTVGAGPVVHGVNLRTKLLGYVPATTSGTVAAGEISTGPSDYPPSMIAEAYAVMALARTGGAPSVMTNYLRGEQCATGYFRAAPDTTTGAYRTCTQAASTPDTDSTAFGLDALIAAKAPISAITKAVQYLLSTQKADGGWIGNATYTPAENANSTGVAVSALIAAQAYLGQTSSLSAAIAQARGKAYTFVSKIQADPSTDSATKLKSEYGAIASNASDYAAARTAGISGTTRSTWTRATPQGLFALTNLSLLALRPYVAPTTSPTTSASASATQATTVTTVVTTTTTISSTATNRPQVNTGASTPGWDGAAAALATLLGLGAAAAAGRAGSRALRRRGRHQA